MKLCKNLFAGIVLFFSVSLSAPLYAQDMGNITFDSGIDGWEMLSSEQRQMVDLLAQDFFERQLTLSQQRNILSVTARHYRQGDEQQQQNMRQQRRQIWRKKNTEDRQITLYDMLTENQKSPFRNHAMRQLGLTPQYFTQTPSRHNPV
ncbi:MAG: hypothetical protein ACWA5L_00970 [bacterium]